jgi:hypothetical protein
VSVMWRTRDLDGAARYLLAWLAGRW